MGRNLVFVVLVAALGACGADEEAAPSKAPDVRRQQNRARDTAATDRSRPELGRWEAALVEDYDAAFSRAQRAYLEAGAPAIERLYDWLRTAADDAERIDFAVEILPQFGEAAIDGALALLDHPNPQVRGRALDVLSGLGAVWFRSDRSDEVARAVFSRVDDPDEDTRDTVQTVLWDARAVIDSLLPAIESRLRKVELPREDGLAGELIFLLSEIGGTSWIDSVTVLVGRDDVDGEIAADATTALGNVRPERPEQVTAILAHLKGGTAETKLRALRILEAWGDDAAAASPYLLTLLGDEDPDISTAAADALGAMPSRGEAAVRALIPLVDENGRALSAIGELSDSVLRMVPSLIAEADSAQPDRRFAILEALRAVDWYLAGPEESLPVEAVRRWMADADPEVRALAVELFEHGEFEYREEVDVLAEVRPALTDPDAFVRRAAVNATAYFARDDGPAAMEPLRPLVRDPSPWIRIDAAQALGDVATVAAELSSDNAVLREYAGWSLRTLAEKAKSEAGAVAAWLDRSKGDEQKLAVNTLKEIEADDPESVRALGRVLADPNSRAFHDAAAALRELGPRALPAALALAKAVDATWGGTAAEALVAIGPEAGTEPVLRELVRLLETLDDVSDVLAALEGLGSGARSAEPAVRTYLEGSRRDGDGLRTLAAIVADKEAFAVELLELLRREPGEVREIHGALLQLGPAGAWGLLTACVPAIERREGRIEDTAEVLSDLGDAGRDAVLRGLGDPDVRATAIRFVGILERDEWAPRLQDAFDEVDPGVRLAAARALESIWDRDFDATSFGDNLIALLALEGEGAATAARMIGRIRTTPRDAAAALTRALATEDPEVRADAAGALFRITDEVEPSLATLAAVLRLSFFDDGSSWDRIGIYLSEMGPRAAPIAEVLNSAILRSTEPAELVRAVGRIGPGAAAAVPGLRSVLAGDGSYDIESLDAAIEAARLLGPAAHAALPELHDRVGNPPSTSCMGPPEGEEADEFDVRVHAAILAIERR